MLRKAVCLWGIASVLVCGAGCDKEKQTTGNKSAQNSSPALAVTPAKSKKVSVPKKKSAVRMIWGHAFVRGSSMTTLKNKYAGFVSKVHVYSHRRVKKGQVILGYDDLPLRTQIAKLQHSVSEAEKSLAQKKLSRIRKRSSMLISMKMMWA